jgi:hypothetical protein
MYLFTSVLVIEVKGYRICVVTDVSFLDSGTIEIAEGQKTMVYDTIRAQLYLFSCVLVVEITRT